MNISRKNGIRFFGSLVLSGTTLNSVGVSTALAMEPAPPAGSLTQKYPNSTCSEIKNSDLYKYIEKTIPQDELERLKIEFEKDNLAAKSDDELLKIFSAKSLRFLVITNKLGSNFNSEKSGKINLAIERAWKLRLHKISEHYRKIFGNYENISQENLCLKFLDLNSADLNKFKLKELFDIQSLFCEILGEKYVLSGEDKCKLSYSLFSSYLRIFGIYDLYELKGVAASLSQKDLRKILKYLLNNFPFYESIQELRLTFMISSLFNVALSCSSRVSGVMYDDLVLPLEKLVKDKNKDEFYKKLDLFKKDCKKLAQLLDKEAETVYVGNYMFNSNSMLLTEFYNSKMQNQEWARKLKV